MRFSPSRGSAAARWISWLQVGLPMRITLYSIVMVGNTTPFNVLLWTNLLQRLVTKPLTIVVNTVVVTVVNRAVYKPVVSHILSKA